MNGLSLPAGPWLLLLLLPAAGLALARGRRRVFPLPGASDLAGHVPKGPWTFWGTGSRVLVLSLIAVALAGPVRTVQTVERKSEGANIVVAFDVSSSMLAEDFRPENRLEVARREIRRFVQGRAGDRIGLVAFAGEALTVVPGTLDHELVLRAVDGLGVGQLQDGTAIGTALATAVHRLRGQAEGARVVVLLTDGDNNRGNVAPLDAAAAARTLGVRVHTIGVGRDGVAPVPIGRTRFGYQYANMPVQVNDELLAAIAERTGGLYFRATDPEGLARVYDRIDALEAVPIREVRTVHSSSVRTELVLLTLLALLAELAGTATRARRSLGP